MKKEVEDVGGGIQQSGSTGYSEWFPMYSSMGDVVPARNVVCLGQGSL